MPDRTEQLRSSLEQFLSRFQPGAAVDIGCLRELYDLAIAAASAAESERMRWYVAELKAKAEAIADTSCNWANGLMDASRYIEAQDKKRLEGK